MKGFIISSGVQISCELEGESWNQGDTIRGKLEIQDSDTPGRVVLVNGAKKKIAAKDAKSVVVIEDKTFSASNEPSSFEIKLDPACPIDGMYMLFGTGEDLFELGNLELPIQADKTIMAFLEVLNIFYKFKVKGTLKTNKKGFVDAKITIPTSKDFSNVKSLKLLLKMDGDNLNVSYNFEVEKINYAEGDAKLQKEKKVFETTLTPKDYLIYGDSVNQDGIMKSISVVLDEVKKKQFSV